MTPDQLNEIEARVAASHPQGKFGPIAADVLALVARVRELEAEGDRTDADRKRLADLQMAMVARAKKAEARVYALELEREDAGAYEGAYEGLWRRTCSNVLQLEARVAVLREALDEANKTCNFQSVGWGRELGARLNLVLATLDPAATALTERLKAAETDRDKWQTIAGEVNSAIARHFKAATALADFAREVDEWIGPVLDGLPAAVADKLIAWRKVKGEP